MKKIRLSLLLFCCATFTSYQVAVAQEQSEIKNARNIKIEATDSLHDIIKKAVHVVPSPNQLSALQNEYIAFVHFGPNTFSRREWGTGNENPALFDLKTLDTDQWCQTMKTAGMKMVILTVKHHDGFVLWQSRYTKHGIMSSPYQNGKGDILKELSQSCQKYGIKLGVYLSPADLYQIENAEGLYGNLSSYTRRTIPREVEGRPFADKRKFSFMVDDYNEYFLNQLFELLTEYGPISEVWFDGAHPKRKGNQQYNYHAWKELIRTLAPKAVIFGREDIRWCGNEGGATRSIEWNVIPYNENPDTMSVFMDRTKQDLGSDLALSQMKKPFYLQYQPAETNTSIRQGWFYRDDNSQEVRSADDVFDIYERAVGGNSIFLLNIPPNREGRFSPRDVESLTEAGRRIRDTYSTNLLQGSNAPAELTDDNLSSCITLGEGEWELVISLPHPITLNRLSLQEPIALHGERIKSHAVDVFTNGTWKEVATAANIGYRRILRFADETTDKIRIRILDSRATPYIATVGAYRYRTRPPMLTAIRNTKGEVTLLQKANSFHWNGTNTAPQEAVSDKYAVYYTTDGSVPTEQSPRYTGSMTAENCTLQATAYQEGEAGAPFVAKYGYRQEGWKVIDTSSSSEGFETANAIDGNPATCWMTTPDDTERYITIDMGDKCSLAAIEYTPQTKDGEGMIESGRILTSNNGKRWKEVARFEFGNLINDPTPRTCTFKKAVKARFIKVEATTIAGESERAAIAELNIFGR